MAGISKLQNKKNKEGFNKVVDDTMKAIYKENYLKNMLNPKESEDTQIRRHVYEIIHDMIEQKKSKEEILCVLMKKYSDTPIAKYFESYINDQMRKLSRDDEDER